MPYFYVLPGRLQMSATFKRLQTKAQNIGKFKLAFSYESSYNNKS
jgi:hypothetical protein